MLSRVAQNIYWMARYLERAEDTARIINVNTNLLLDLPRNTTFGWLPMIFIVGAEHLFFEKDPHRLADENTVVKFLISDRGHPGSIISSLASARENLRTTRDTVPQDAWEQVNSLYIYARDHVPSRRGRFEFLRRVIHGVQQINGMLAGTMSQTAAYDFAWLGRYLERADMTTRILDVRSANLLPRPGQAAAAQTQTQEATESSLSQSQGVVVPERGEQDPFESIQWMSVLKSLSAYQVYRQQVRLRVGGPDVLKFLLQNKFFPRAVACCLKQLEVCLLELPGNTVPLAGIAALKQRLNSATVPDLAHEGLHEFIDELQVGFGELHGQIAAAYFTH